MDSEPAVAEAPRLICIHGTGAGALDREAPRWWQPASAFTRRLAEALGPHLRVAKPFRWSGANLESHRRDAGRRLLRRLRALDAAGRSYHLVAHSHGGSVAWHALVASAEAGGAPLTGLRTWTTVGTPFLRFAPDPTVWRYAVGLCLAGAATAALSGRVLEGWSERAAILRDGDPALALLVAALYAALCATLLVCGARLVVHVADGLRHRRTRAAEAEAFARYGSRWLALWHDHDEPIVGLRASLCDPMRLVPLRGGASAPLVRRLAWAWYDHWVVPVSDQAAWGIGMARAQGADIIGSRMVAASPAPANLETAWAALPPEAAGPMLASANAKASLAAAALRDRLARFGRFGGADEAIASLALSFTWQELIHTSYFDHDAVVRLVAGHIAESGGAARGSAPDALDLWRRARPAPILDPPVARRRLIALPIARTVNVALASGLAAVAAWASYDAWIAPLTARRALDQIERQLGMPEFLSAEDEPGVGEALLRLFALGRTASPGPVLGTIIEAGTRRLAAERFAVALGGGVPEVGGWLSEAGRARVAGLPAPGRLHRASEAALSDLSIYGDGNKVTLRADFLSGLLRAGVAPDVIAGTRAVPELMDEVRAWRRPRFVPFTNPLRTPKPEPERPPELGPPPALKPGEVELVTEAAAMVLALGFEAEADELLVIATGSGRDALACSTPVHFASRLARLGASEPALRAARACPVPSPERRVLLAALAADEAGRTDAARALLATVPDVSLAGLQRPARARAVLLLLDLGRTDAAAAAAADLLAVWQMPEAGEGRIAALADRFEKAGRRDLAGTIRSTMTAKLREDVLDLSGDGGFGQRSARELAALLRAGGRRADLVALAEAVEASESPTEGQQAEAALRAGILLAAAGDARAAGRLAAGVGTAPSFDEVEEILGRACTVIALADAAGSGTVRTAVQVASAAIVERVRTAERADLFAALAQRLAEAGYVNDAMTLAARRLDVPRTLRVHRAILDRALDRDAPGRARAWGLDRPWTPFGGATPKAGGSPCPG